MTGMHIRQCPRCELRFTSIGELEDHLSTDHHPRPPVAPPVVDASPPAAAVVTAPAAMAPPAAVATRPRTEPRSTRLIGLRDRVRTWLRR